MNAAPKQACRRILVMDDNREIHRDFRKILCADSGQANAAAQEAAEAFLFGSAPEAKSPVNFAIDSAYQGQEGLEMVRRAVAEQRPYPAAFVDVRMPPGWDGIETISRVWEVDPDLQVIICTAYSDYSLTGMTTKLGRPDQFVILKKPFDVVEVQQLADAMVAKWEGLQRTRQRFGQLQGSVDRWLTELQASREETAELAMGLSQPASHVAGHTRFLKNAFDRIREVLRLQEGLLNAVKTGQETSIPVSELEEALRAAELGDLMPRIPDVLRQLEKEAEALAGMAGANRGSAPTGVGFGL